MACLALATNRPLMRLLQPRVRCGDLWILRFIILEDLAEHAAAGACR